MPTSTVLRSISHSFSLSQIQTHTHTHTHTMANTAHANEQRTTAWTVLTFFIFYLLYKGYSRKVKQLQSTNEEH